MLKTTVSLLQPPFAAATADDNDEHRPYAECNFTACNAVMLSKKSEGMEVKDGDGFDDSQLGKEGATSPPVTPIFPCCVEMVPVTSTAKGGQKAGEKKEKKEGEEGNSCPVLDRVFAIVSATAIFPLSGAPGRTHLRRQQCWPRHWTHQRLLFEFRHRRQLVSSIVIVSISGSVFVIVINSWFLASSTWVRRRRQLFLASFRWVRHRRQLLHPELEKMGSLAGGEDGFIVDHPRLLRLSPLALYPSPGRGGAAAWKIGFERPGRCGRWIYCWQRRPRSRLRRRKGR